MTTCTCLQLLYLFKDGATPLICAARGYATLTCVERLLTTPSIDVNIADKVSSCFLNRIDSTSTCIQTVKHKENSYKSTPCNLDLLC